MENVFFPQFQLHWIQECLEFLLLEIGRFELQAAPRMNCRVHLPPSRIPSQMCTLQDKVLKGPALRIVACG
ncbi:hypothetical protein NDU88_004956 [Pleurodeles waltl]|uniref:Uncharacterized protein n=1 Tax=Pleurodeles waltl TaxID=8319 RepID=A0AAV7TA94_PLEWA|nr:hypothetical protein NDU88_004956 [Pleurodeles waltl]